MNAIDTAISTIGDINYHMLSKNIRDIFTQIETCKHPNLSWDELKEAVSHDAHRARLHEGIWEKYQKRVSKLEAWRRREGKAIEAMIN